MTTWIIEPRDPLIVRDGRPFGPNPGARAQSLPFPYPSTTTGGIRTRAGQNGNGIFTADPNKVKQIAVRGPLLVELGDNATITDWLFPAPADVLLLKLDREEEMTEHAAASDSGSNEDEKIKRRQLVPLQLPDGCQTNLPSGLTLVGLPNHDPSKPAKNAPRYWHWKTYKQWLQNPTNDTKTPAELGHDGPTNEQRIHVAITPDTFTSEEGALFQTRGLEFSRTSGNLSDVKRLGIAIETAADITPTIAPLGGERRLMNWQQSATPFLDMPKELKKEICEKKHCRLLLLTPAYFKKDDGNEGWCPTDLFQTKHNVTSKLAAVALPHYQVVSGWDFAYINPQTRRRGRPKPTRRLAPAGTVFFVELNGEKEDIANWLNDIWMCPVSDGMQERLDGFGLAAIGSWDGTPTPLSVQKEKTT